MSTNAPDPNRPGPRNPAPGNPAPGNPASPAKDPDEWVTGDEPMTGPQASYLSTLAQDAGEDPPGDDLTKAEASKRIEELQERTGRGQQPGG